MAAGNTFGATALGSYGGFWISFAIILTPGGFDISAQYENPVGFNYALGLFLFVCLTTILYPTLPRLIY
jgi:succinate-acetate transporter protein